MNYYAFSLPFFHSLKIDSLKCSVHYNVELDVSITKYLQNVSRYPFPLSSHDKLFNVKKKPYLYCEYKKKSPIQ